MKRVLSICLVLLMIFAFGLNTFAAPTLNLINNNHGENNLINPIANVLEISGDPSEIISNTENLGVAVMDATSVSDFTALLKSCKSNGVVPVFYVDNNEEADKIIEAMGSKQANLRDVTAVSENADVLSYIHGKSVFVRTGLQVQIENPALTAKEANEIRKKVRSAPASFCVIDSKNATRQAVSELQILAVGVWVKVSSSPDSAEFVTETVKALTSGANGIISADCNAVTKVINDNFSENSMTRTPIMIGHRGNPTQAPENTLSGYITAYENGADIFEIDVEITADGEIIILHDGNLKRTTDYEGTKTVGQMKLSEIKEYHILDKNGNVTEETVPTLREVLDEFKDKDCRIFVEFKGSNIQNVIKTAQIIKEYDMEEKIDVISFSSKLLDQSHKSMPGISTGCLVSYENLPAKNQEEALVALYRGMSDAQNNESSINIGANSYSRYFQQVATDRGMTVWPWTYLASSNDIPFMAGCDGLTTDDVQWAKDMVKYIQPNVQSVEVGVNANAEITVSSTTYGGAVTQINATDLEIKVLNGAEYVKVENGNINGVADGTATVIYGYKTKTTSGSEYVLYTQPVDVTVNSALSNPTDSTDNTAQDGPNWFVIGIATGVIIALALVVFLVLKNKKK